MARPQVTAKPIKHWLTGIADVNGEPLLQLDFLDGSQVIAMMSVETAKAMAQGITNVVKKID